MGLNSFVPPGDDDDDTANSGGAPVIAGPPSLPSTNTSVIEDMLIDYNERFKNSHPAMFRDKVIEQTLAVLIRRDKPNPLLVGPAGVGKTRIVEEIARLIAIGSPAIPTALRDKTIYELPMGSLVAGAGIVGQLETRVVALVDYFTDPDNKAILFIDEIHVLADSRDPVYSKVAQILKPALARGDMHVIGATTTQEARNLEDDPAFQRRFTRLVVDELTREQTIEVLRVARPVYSAHYGYKVAVSDEMLVLTAAVADETARASQHRPDTAITLLDQALADIVVAHNAAVARAAAAGNQAVQQALLSIPVLTLTESKLRSVAMRLASGVAEKSAFDKEAIINDLSGILGQDEVLTELVDTLQREELGAFARKRPTAWMLAGPSGSGKTETVKRISEALTGQPPIILNMGEYHTAWDASKLIGAGPGYVGSDSNKELPFDTLESNPYRVILLDEIEKADRTIHRLLLTALDEGWMRMADGKIIDFSKATIIATTNAARDQMTKTSVGFTGNSGSSVRMTQQQLVTALGTSFDAEFLGRFQRLVAYAQISKSTYAQILGNAYNRERERLLTENPRLGAKVPELDDAALASTVQATYLAEQGARPAERAARTLIEDAILEAQAAALAAPMGGGLPVTPAGPATAVWGQDEPAEEDSTEVA